MDLVQTVRKEGSRGGRGEFKWEDVKSSQHRENYLGHSLMAPVGRWQQGRDLNWYARNGEDDERAAEEARREELRRIKEAEEDAMAAALGLPVKPRNANMEPLGEKPKINVRKIVEEGFEEEDDMGKTAGLSGYSGRAGAREGEGDVLEGASGSAVQVSRNDGREERRRRSRSRSRDRRRDDKRDQRRRQRSRSRSRDRDRRRPRRHASRSRSRDRERRRSRSRDRQHRKRERNHDGGRERSRSRDRQRNRSRSPRDHHRDRRRN